jgi:hypothetical protein
MAARIRVHTHEQEPAYADANSPSELEGGQRCTKLRDKAPSLPGDTLLFFDS